MLWERGSKGYGGAVLRPAERRLRRIMIRKYATIFVSGAIALLVVWLGLWFRDRADRSSRGGAAAEPSQEEARDPAGAPAAAASDRPAEAARRAIAPRSYEHPVLVEQTPAPHPPDCSKAALSQVAATARELEKSAAAMTSAQAKRGEGPDACSAEQAAPWKSMQDQLLDRVSGCVGQDSPLDDPWNLVESALLAVGSCIDCSAAPTARLSKCRHARKLLGAVEKPASQ